MQDRARSDADSGSLGPHSEGEQRPGAMQHYVAHQQMQQQNSHGMGQPYQQLLSPPGSEQQLFGPWVKYYIQRVSTNVNHVLFYVVDSAGNAKLAVVGTDVKLSGHFVYASVSDMSEYAPLRCTNRQKVLEWLGQLGALDLAEDHEVTLPQLAPHQWQQLHSNSPMLMKPKLDRDYTSWRENSGVMPDGRHFKHFYLVDASTGVERLAVVGEDSARQDRRYTYKAMEELGGFCFENGKAVQDWLDYICGRGPPPQTQMPARGKLTERKRGRKKRGAGGTTEDDTDQDLGPYTNQYGVPPAQAGLTRFGSGALPPPGPGGSMYAAAQPGLPLPFDQQYMGGAPQAPLSPYGSGSLTRPLGPPAGQLQPPPAASAMQDQMDMQEAVRAAGEEVRQLFSVGGQRLLTFVTHVPNPGGTEVTAEMCQRLNSFVEALGLTGAPGSSAVNAQEVMSILQFLAERPASLKLLETTGIGRPVALLSRMHDVLAAQGQQLRPEAANELEPVHRLAQQLAATWHELAVTAQKLASEALETSAGPMEM